MPSPIEKPALPSDIDDDPLERFPRELTIRFEDDHTNPDDPLLRMYLEHASPNTFENGPIVNYLGLGPNKSQGYAYGPLGDPLTDRSFVDGGDGYRFHDALHLSLLTLTNYSVVMRNLLNVRRRSRPRVDAVEDGPRAVIVEEAILNEYGLELSHEMLDPRLIHTASRLGEAAARSIQPFLQKNTHIPAEKWAESLRVGGYLMYLLEYRIGGITDHDRRPDVPDEEKRHSATVTFNLDMQRIVMETEAHTTDIRRFQQSLDSLHMRRHTGPTLMGIVNGQAYYLDT